MTIKFVPNIDKSSLKHVMFSQMRLDCVQMSLECWFHMVIQFSRKVSV